MQDRRRRTAVEEFRIVARILMATAALLGAYVALSGCAATARTAVELKLGHKVRDGGFHGDSPVASLRVRRAIGARWFAEYEHVSHPLLGPPFGPRSEEDTLDVVGFGVRWGE